MSVECERFKESCLGCLYNVKDLKKKKKIFWDSCPNNLFAFSERTDIYEGRGAKRGKTWQGLS